MMAKGGFLFVVLSLAICIPNVSAYPKGAPVGVCTSMAPSVDRHEAKPQATKSSPFIVLVGKSTYEPNESINVTVKSCSSATIEGVLIQARVKGSSKAIGYFTTKPANTHYLKCPNATAENTTSVVTHSKPLKLKSVQFEWKPSNETTGTIHFLATVVQHKTTYWVQLPSIDLTRKVPGKKDIPPENPKCSDKVPSGATWLMASSVGIVVLFISLYTLKFLR